MKKRNPVTDYAIDAFRYWAECGCPTYSSEMERLTEECAEKAENLAERIAEESARMLDFLACEETFRELIESDRLEVCEAVEAVYMVSPKRRAKRKEVTERVVAFAKEKYMSESGVYRCLREAFQVFGIKRGLRVV